MNECVAALIELSDRQREPDPLRASRTPGFDLVLGAAVAARRLVLGAVAGLATAVRRRTGVGAGASAGR